MRILGIDPGSRATGFGVVDFDGGRPRRVAGDVIRTAEGSLVVRLTRIFAELERVIAATKPDAAALESVFASHNVRSALVLGHARGAALLACGRAGLPVAEYAPAQVKGAVAGYGRAAKGQVQRMVARLLALEACPPVDEADALAVALCHGHGARGLERVRGAEALAGARRRS